MLITFTKIYFLTHFMSIYASEDDKTSLLMGKITIENSNVFMIQKKHKV